MPLPNQQSGTVAMDSNLIESVTAEEAENNEPDNNAANNAQNAAAYGPLSPQSPRVPTNIPRKFQYPERRRLVDRTVSEGQLKLPASLMKKAASLDKTTSLDADDRPDFFEYHAKDLLPSKGSSSLTKKFLQEVVDILMEYTQNTFDRSCKILDFHYPHELREKMHLEIPDKPENLDQILFDCRNTLKYCVTTGHPRFFNQLSQGLDVVSMAGEWVTATANTNMFTYEIAPAFIVIERTVLKKMREIIGFKDGDGIFCPGGAISNLYAVLAARHRHMPACKRRGLSGMRTLTMFTSEHSHFSIKRAAAISGIGTDNVVMIDTDNRGKMQLDDLENKIQQTIARGDVPFFVNATGGTTVVGAFDPIMGIADICEKYKLWMHVDCAWGGGVLLSRKKRHLLEGIDRADSVTWNPHKIMGITLQCSAIIIKDDGLLEDCNSMRATYLFQQDKQYDVSFDTGDKAIQCGRHVDVFKLWLTWRAKGTRGFETQVNKLFDLAKYLIDKVKARDGFKLVYEKPEYLNVCFWYLPPSIRHMEDKQEQQMLLHKVAPEIKARMMEAGSLMVGYQPLGNFVNFFRMITSNPASTKADIDYLMDEIDRLGKTIEFEES